MTHGALVEVLEHTRRLLARVDNDFSWSGWQNGSEAVAEIDDILGQIAAVETIQLLPLKVLFAPTGPLQEVSMVSGWSDEFLSLASRFDEAIADL